TDSYDRLLNILHNRGYFYFKNYSVPRIDPIIGAQGDIALYSAIKSQMSPSSVVLILAGVYATYSKWIDAEIRIAKEYGKPIIAIEPWGSERTSTVVKNAADRIVKWNADSIVAAIRELS
ncbi:TPA: TIR domain-containing protein, partial [Klebsiella pneumoniae]|nr:TIR domain-containing protein [Klebsiella pneumoniae]